VKKEKRTPSPPTPSTSAAVVWGKNWVTAMKSVA
jgi:hypothetical protein